MTLKHQNEAGTAQLVAALERAWRAIADRHPDLPAAALILGQGSGRPGGGLVLGHFAAERWQHTSTAGEPAMYVHEVLIGGEGLARGARDVLATLLHEGAHALAAVRQIPDTSRQGRYHNKRYKQLAEEVGLVIERDPVIGWSLTTLPHHTATAYKTTIADIDSAITLHRRSETPVRPGATTSANLIAAACQCPRRIRVAPGTLTQGAIVCELCEQPFTPTQPQTRAATTP